MVTTTSRANNRKFVFLQELQRFLNWEAPQAPAGESSQPADQTHSQTLITTDLLHPSGVSLHTSTHYTCSYFPIIYERMVIKMKFYKDHSTTSFFIVHRDYSNSKHQDLFFILMTSLVNVFLFGTAPSMVPQRWCTVQINKNPQYSCTFRHKINLTRHMINILPHLSHHSLLVLFLLGDLDWW